MSARLPSCWHLPFPAALLIPCILPALTGTGTGEINSSCFQRACLLMEKECKQTRSDGGRGDAGQNTWCVCGHHAGALRTLGHRLQRHPFLSARLVSFHTVEDGGSERHSSGSSHTSGRRVRWHPNPGRGFQGPCCLNTVRGGPTTVVWTCLHGLFVNSGSW